MGLSTVNSMAFGLAVYASPSSLPHPTQNSLPVAGQALLDGIHTRKVPLKGFKVVDHILSPFPKLPCAIDATSASLIEGQLTAVAPPLQVGPHHRPLRLPGREAGLPRLPDPKGDGTQAGVPRNFQILSPLDFLAEFTQHIPPKGSHLIRYYGWYSNKSRGMRKKAEAEASAESSSEEAAATGSSQSWAMLIKRVFEVDPLCCPECGGQMKVVSFIEPPQADVIEEILKHCGLWQSRSPRAPPDVDELVLELDAAYSGSSIDSLGIQHNLGGSHMVSTASNAR